LLKGTDIRFYPMWWILFTLAFCIVIIPKKTVGSIAVGLDDLICLALLPFVLWFLLSESWLFKGWRLGLLCIWLMIVFTGIVYGLLGSAYYLEQLTIPTEMWQYMKRLIFFYFTLYLAWNRKISSERFYSVLVVVVVVAALMGIIQVLPGSAGRTLANVYARTDVVKSKLLDRSFFLARNYGIAGHSIAWGGFSAFSVAIAASCLAAGRQYTKDLKLFTRLLIWSLLLMSLFNVVLSGSKASILSLLVILTVILSDTIYRNRRNIRFMVKLSIMMGTFVSLTAYFLMSRLAYLMYRVMSLLETRGGGRLEQVNMALALVNDWFSPFFGVGNVYQRAMATSFGTEVEPVFLFVNYGLVGVLLRYGLLAIVLMISWRLVARSTGADRILAMAAVSSILGYAFFSLGYFFFQEIYVGLLPWLLYGWVVGRYFRQSRDRQIGLA